MIKVRKKIEKKIIKIYLNTKFISYFGKTLIKFFSWASSKYKIQIYKNLWYIPPIMIRYKK